jgi:hypothetical protein
MLYVRYVHLTKAKRDKHIPWSEMMLRKDYDRKSSVKKKTGRDPQRTWHQDELIGGKSPVVK